MVLRLNLARIDGANVDSEGNELSICYEHISAFSKGSEHVGSLLSVIREFGALDASVIQSYCRQVLEGLSFLHRNNCAVGGLTANNVLVTERGVIKLSDCK